MGTFRATEAGTPLMCWSGEHWLPRCLEYVMLLALLLLLFLFIIVFKTKSQGSSVCKFDLFNMLLADMDVGKTVLGEESKVATQWAWSVIPLKKQNRRNNHAWSKTQVFFLCLLTYCLYWADEENNAPASYIKKRLLWQVLPCKLQISHCLQNKTISHGVRQ